MGAATWVPGTPAHSWQAVAAGGTSIGKKGMMVAAKTLTLTAIDLLGPALVAKAREEFLERRGADFFIFHFLETGHLPWITGNNLNYT